MYEAQLINGESIIIEGSPEMINETLVFVKLLGGAVVIGIVDSETNNGVYIWQNMGGYYKYTGHIGFNVEKDRLMTWDVNPVLDNERAKKIALEKLVEQLEVMKKMEFPINVKLTMFSERAGNQVEEKPQSLSAGFSRPFPGKSSAMEC